MHCCCTAAAATLHAVGHRHDGYRGLFLNTHKEASGSRQWSFSECLVHIKRDLQIKCKSSHFHRSHLRLNEEKLTVLHVSFSYVSLFLHCMQYLLFCCFSLWVVLRKQWRKLWLCWVVKCHYCDTSMFLYVERSYRETGLACKLVWRIITHLNASCCTGVFESNTWWTAVLFTSWVTVLGFLTLTQLLNSYSAFAAVSLVLKCERLPCVSLRCRTPCSCGSYSAEDKSDTTVTQTAPTLSEHNCSSLHSSWWYKLWAERLTWWKQTSVDTSPAPLSLS